jgi:uncharacterized damage-inducible protein DinB
MDLLAHFERLIAYDDWANRESLAALRAGPEGEATKLLAHVIACEFLWLDRIAHRPRRCAVWPTWGTDESAAQLDELPGVWRNFLRGLDARALDTEVSYVNTKGQHFTSTVGDILTHVMLHGAYHRGQLARAQRQAGATPAYTDYIHAVREGCLDPGGD